MKGLIKLIKKFSIVIMTLTIALCSLSCTAGYNDEKSTTEANTTVLTETASEPASELITEHTTAISTTVQTTTEQATEPVTKRPEASSSTTDVNESTTAKINPRPTVKNNPTTKKATVTSASGKNLGNFKITVYTPGSDGGAWGYQTATGVRSRHLSTCAVDPDIIPLGSTIQIDGLTLLACDTGSAVQGNVIDIFYDGSDGEACEWVNNFGTYHNVQKL